MYVIKLFQEKDNSDNVNGVVMSILYIIYDNEGTVAICLPGWFLIEYSTLTLFKYPGWQTCAINCNHVDNDVKMFLDSQLLNHLSLNMRPNT